MLLEILTIFPVVLHIIFCFIVLAVAVVIHQATQGIWEAYSEGPQRQKRWKDQRFEAFSKIPPPPEYARLAFWRAVPFISVIPSCLAIALLYVIIPAPRL
jgi:hypothetical protein